MSKIAIVTDSGVNFPAEVLARYPIHVIPFQIMWGNQTYLDCVDIQPEEFYARLQSSKETPTTSQPSPAAFLEKYKELLGQGYEILSVQISAKLSGTVDSAVQAIAELPGAPIELIDAQSTSMAMGFQIMAAARAIQEGASLKECRAIVEQARQFSGLYFVVETLEFLRRGGRIGGGAAFLGNLLDLKPILALQHGVIEAVGKVRTAKKAIDRMLDLVEGDIAGRQPVRLCAIHANALPQAQELLKLATSRFEKMNIVEAIIAGVSPAIGTHAGPGTVGMAFLAGM